MSKTEQEPTKMQRDEIDRMSYKEMRHLWDTAPRFDSRFCGRRGEYFKRSMDFKQELEPRDIRDAK